MFDDWNVLKANKRLEITFILFLFGSVKAEIEFQFLLLLKLIEKLEIISDCNNLIQHKVHHLISGFRLRGYDHSEEIFKTLTRQRLIADH